MSGKLKNRYIELEHNAFKYILINKDEGIHILEKNTTGTDVDVIKDLLILKKTVIEPVSLEEPHGVYIITVSSSKFYIDGVQQQSLSLHRGFIYQFDQSNSSNSTHSLKFSTTNNGSEYTTGVSNNGGTAGTDLVTTWKVPQDAPSTMYYYCVNHSGMGGVINVT